MVERTPKGRQVRRYFIECERLAKEAAQAPAYYIPKDYPEALMLASEQAKQITEQKQQIEEMQPKASAYDRFMNSDGLFGLQNAARALGCRPNLFIRWLKQVYLFYQGGSLVPRIQFIRGGLFEVKAEPAGDKTFPQTYVTPRGMEYLSSRVPSHVKVGAA